MSPAPCIASFEFSAEFGVPPYTFHYSVDVDDVDVDITTNLVGGVYTVTFSSDTVGEHEKYITVWVEDTVTTGIGFQNWGTFGVRFTIT